MTDYEIGYGRPPQSGKFKAGVSGNPKGRPRRKPLPIADTVEAVLSTPMKYRERGRTHTATRNEVNLKILVERAIKGDVAAADLVLRCRAHAQRHGEAGVERLTVTDWLPDYPGQTAEQKTRDLPSGGSAGGVQRHICPTPDEKNPT